MNDENNFFVNINIEDLEKIGKDGDYLIDKISPILKEYLGEYNSLDRTKKHVKFIAIANALSVFFSSVVVFLNFDEEICISILFSKILDRFKDLKELND